MPTVTVLAWCLMASTGRVSSSMARGERGGEVLDARRSACRPCRTRSGTRRAAAMPMRVAEQRREPHRGAGLEVAVVGAAAQPVEERGGERLERRRAGRSSSASPSTAPRRRRPRPRSRRAPRAADGPARRWRARPRSRTGGRPSPRARTPASGATAGTAITCERGGEALLALGGDHDRRRLVGPVDRDLLGHVVGVRARRARRRTRG